MAPQVSRVGEQTTRYITESITELQAWNVTETVVVLASIIDLGSPWRLLEHQKLQELPQVAATGWLPLQPPVMALARPGLPQ
jgi:hypothetical protein